MEEKFVENYKIMSDEKIIEEINNGNYELFQIIIKRYYPVIYYYINKLCPISYREDAFQEASFALYSAVKDFENSKSSFKTFATLCIKRSVIQVLKSQKLKKNIPEELISSIEDVALVDSNTPEKILIDKESLKTLEKSIKLELSPLEYEVLQCYLSGDKYNDIANKLGIPQKSVDNSLARIRKKLKK